MLPIRIMTRDFNLIGEIDQYASLQITRSWHSLGKIELHVNRYLKGADKLQRGCIIFPQNYKNKGYVIRHREIQLDENGKLSENWVIHALPLKSWTSQRITYPPSHTAYDNRQADAESVIRHYVNNNLTNPDDVSRRMTDIILDANESKGDNISWQSRFKNLAEEIEEISLLSGLGWNIEIDTDNEQFIFRVLEGKDRTVNQSSLPPAIFSPEFGTLKELEFMESDLNYKNFAIVAGQGEGVDREIINVGNSTGADRYELFVDARDIEDGADLPNRGNQKLKEHEQELYLDGQALMGRVAKNVPTQLTGTHPDATISESDIETLFVSPYQTVQNTNPIIFKIAPINLSRLSRYKNSIFTWNVDKPQGTNAFVEYSFDNENWTLLRNGDGLPFDEGEILNSKTLYLRFNLATIHADIFPSLSNFEYTINGYAIKETISTARLQYEEDYDLGDLVTLQNKEWGVTLDTRITEVTEIYEPSGMQINLVFGNSKPTIIDKIKEELSGIKTEILR